MNNINIVNFTRNEYIGVVRNLVQWNYGQTLRIKGLELPSTVEVHFSLQDDFGMAISRIGVTRNGYTEVEIPTFIFEYPTTNDYNAYAYITDNGTTKHKIILKIKARPMPERLNSEEDKKLFAETLAEINEMIQKTKDGANTAQSYAVGNTNTRFGEDTDNAKYYSEQAKLIKNLISDDKNEIDNLISKFNDEVNKAIEEIRRVSQEEQNKILGVQNNG